MYAKIFKRIFDFFLSLTAILFLLPLIIVVAMLLLAVNKGNPFFYQRRPGKNEKIFSVIKFKTMTDQRDSSGQLLPDKDRLTSFGRFIRKTSLDELPQLFNVLKGDMSIIGPRPLLVRYLPFYTPIERTRHLVRPGITGLAQVNGRNTVRWDDRLAFDVEYVKNVSFQLDLHILYKTLLKVVKSENIVVDPTSVMSDLDVERSEK